MDKIYILEEIIANAKNNSPFYKQLYKNIDDISDLSKLPIVDQSEFWKNNTFANNQVCTGKISGGVVFKSGGTTGNPKFSWFTKDEWETFTTIFGYGMSKLDIENNDRVANLFYVGEMYASFLFINKSLENSPLNVLQFPIAGHTSLDSLINTINDYDINVLMGVPTTFVQMALNLEKSNNSKTHLALGKIDKIFYGGESLFAEQEHLLKRVFKNLHVLSSIGYASVDAGHLGFCSKDFKKGIHGVFKQNSIMEIIDEMTGETISDSERVGKLVYTNLTRLGMPIIRYPVGDRARWVPNAIGEQFELMGRSDEGARIGPVTVTREDIVQAFKRADLFDNLDLFQLKIERKLGKDSLTILFSAHKSFSQDDLTKITDSFYLERKMYRESVEKGLVSSVEFVQIAGTDFVRNPRTGKLIFVSDKRFS